MVVMEIGYLKGETCNRKGCKGVLEAGDREPCSCHIAPPCSSCTASVEFCPMCHWQGKDEVWPKYIPTEYAGLSVSVPKPIALDSTKIDWRVLPHSSSSQLCRGVYPEGTSVKDVEARVKGTFGGRFNYFNNGKFEYVAYTD